MADKRTPRQLARAIEEWLLNLIFSGALIDPGVDALYEQMEQEFAEDFTDENPSYTKDVFLDAIEKLVWTEGPQGTLTNIENYVRWGMDLEKFQQFYSYIPLEMIKSKARELRGITNVLHPITQSPDFVRGIWRFAGKAGLTGSGEFELPSTSFARPYEIPMQSRDWEVPIINGINLGLPHSHLISENPVRRALAQAEQDKREAVILTNIFDVETRRAAGPSRVLQGLLSGVTVHVEALDQAYQQEAKRVLAAYVEEQKEESLQNGKNPDVLYITAAEIFAHLMRGLRKIAFKTESKPGSEKKPEYSGNIYIVLGINDERLIVAAAYGEIHYTNIVKQHQLRAEARTAFSAARRLAREGKKEESENFAQEANRLLDLQARTRITNVSAEDWQRYYNRALAFFVQSLEDPDVLPNSKVIGKGTTHVKIGTKHVELNIPSHANVTDTLLSHYTNTYGPKVLRQEMADIVVICHPYSLGAKLTAREADHEGQRRAVKVCVAPICVDTKFLREKLRHIVRKTHPMQKSAFSELSAPGVLSVNCTDNVINITEFPLEALAAFETYAKKTHRAKAAYSPKYIWIKVATDQHWGSKTQELVTCHACRVKLTMSDAVFHALRHAGYNNTENLPPIHAYVANDDPTQGHHFPAEHEPHPHELYLPVIEEEMRKRLEHARNALRHDLREEVEKDLDTLVEFALYQFHTKGVYTTTAQMLLFLQNYLKQNADMFDGILRRAIRAGIIVRGVSDFTQVHAPYAIADSRDVGLISIGTGNHFLKTVDGSISEGPIYAEFLRARLLQDIFWKGKENIIQRYVKGPTYGKEFIAWGTIKGPHGYEWGLDFRNTPPGRGVDWGDPLRIAVANDLRRANYARMHEGKVTLKVYGDKHFLSSVRTPHALYVMGPPGTHTDLYGELGFPPNNTGVVFIGLPTEGPDAGPILIRALLYDDIRDLVQDHPRTFDWENFLPNPL